MTRAQIWFRDDNGTMVAFVADAPRIEGRGLTKDEALGDLVRRNADRFAIVTSHGMDASDIMVSPHGAEPDGIEVCSGG